MCVCGWCVGNRDHEDYPTFASWWKTLPQAPTAAGHLLVPSGRCWYRLSSYWWKLQGKSYYTVLYTWPMSLLLLLNFTDLCHPPKYHCCDFTHDLSVVLLTLD